MNAYYGDILERIPEQPKWWDERAVPRFCDFDPDEAADIYADEAILLLITCQNCGLPFHVCMTLSALDRTGWRRGRDGSVERVKSPSLRELIVTGEIHYGDPPNASCCLAGPTMNSVPRRVLGYWRKDGVREWERVPALERDIAPDWAADAPPTEPRP